MKTKFPLQVLFALLLVPLLAACGSQRRFVAPEIDPPSDLIPGYVPEGFELVSGFRIEIGDISTRFIAEDDEGRIFCDRDLIDPFFDLKSPAGNDILGVYYDNDDQMLLITKSSFPGGSLDSWRATYEASYAEDCDCDCDCCDCLQIAIGVPFPLRMAGIREIRTVGETQVAVLESDVFGLITVFVRGEYLIAVEGDLPLEEHLRIVESLLE